jgi:hypothetical protein
MLPYTECHISQSLIKRTLFVKMYAIFSSVWGVVQIFSGCGLYNILARSHKRLSLVKKLYGPCL